VSSDAAVDRECAVFTRHLLGMEADAYVTSRYRMALPAVPALKPVTAWDRALLSVARRNVVAAKCADAYAALFDRSSALRKRLVILLAILETRPPYANRIDLAPGGSPLMAVAAVAGRGLLSLLALAVGTLTLVPLRLFFIGRRSSR
jgi:hypothetical protein